MWVGRSRISIKVSFCLFQVSTLSCVDETGRPVGSVGISQNELHACVLVCITSALVDLPCGVRQTLGTLAVSIQATGP